MTTDHDVAEITLEAPIDRVWAALTEPRHVAVWFGPTRPGVELGPGAVSTVDHGDEATYLTRIEQVDPPRRLSYRWASVYPEEMARAHSSTLVEFTLEPVGESTRLVLVQSGFATLPIPPTQQTQASHEGHRGWAEALEQFIEHALDVAGRAERPQVSLSHANKDHRHL